VGWGWLGREAWAADRAAANWCVHLVGAQRIRRAKAQAGRTAHSLLRQAAPPTLARVRSSSANRRIVRRCRNSESYRSL